MSYNMTFMDTSNNIVNIVTGVNTASNGFLGLMFLVVLWIALFAAFKHYDTMKSVIVCSFVTMIAASLMFFASLIAWWITLVFIILFLSSLLLHFFT